MIRRPLPSTGSLGSVPPLRRYYETLRLPAAHLAALRCLRLAIPPLRPLFRSRRPPSAADRGPGVWSPGTPGRDLARRRQGLPGSWGTLVCTCPVLRPRRDRARQAIAALSARPPSTATTTAPAMSHFRGSITRPSHSLSTLRSAGHPAATQDSLPAAGQALPGGIGYPQGSLERFQSSLHLSSFPRLPWRTVVLEARGLAHDGLSVPQRSKHVI